MPARLEVSDELSPLRGGELEGLDELLDDELEVLS